MRMAQQQRQINDLQGLRIGGLQHHRRRDADACRLQPAVRAQAPAIPRVQAGKAVLGTRRGNLRLESGTRMQFKVANQTDVETSKK